MEEKSGCPMTPFDEITTPADIRTLKLMIPYIPFPARRYLGIFIKFQELQSTIHFFRNPDSRICHAHSTGPPPSLWDILEEITPFLRPEEAETVNNLKNILNMMEMVQMMQSMQSTDNPDSNSHSSDNPFSDMSSPLNMLMGMLSPEQKNMFDMYQSLFSDSDSGDTASGTDASSGGVSASEQDPTL